MGVLLTMIEKMQGLVLFGIEAAPRHLISVRPISIPRQEKACSNSSKYAVYPPHQRFQNLPTCLPEDPLTIRFMASSMAL